MSSVAMSICEDRDADWVSADAMPEIVNLAAPKTAAVFLAIAAARESSWRDDRDSIDLDELLGFGDSDPELTADVGQDMDDRWDD
jgi:hypothetical protein